MLIFRIIENITAFSDELREFFLFCQEEKAAETTENS